MINKKYYFSLSKINNIMKNENGDLTCEEFPFQIQGRKIVYGTVEGVGSG